MRTVLTDVDSSKAGDKFTQYSVRIISLLGNFGTQDLSQIYYLTIYWILHLRFIITFHYTMQLGEIHTSQNMSL